MLIILSFFLLVALIFILMPVKFFIDRKKKELNFKEMPTSEIKSIIMFVSDTKEGKGISDLLTFKILRQLSENGQKKNIWLIHSPISDEKGSSYENTWNLAKEFKNDNCNITCRGINDIFDIKESFNTIRDILDSTNSKEIVCDFTSGTKPMSLGMALACIDEKRLIYFPKTDKDDASRYLHINLGELID